MSKIIIECDNFVLNSFCIHDVVYTWCGIWHNDKYLICITQI